MPLAPRYSRAATAGPRLAAEVVATIRRRGRLALDYSEDSLTLVDRIVRSMRLGAPVASAEALTGPAAEMLLGFGAYLGEVVVRNASAEWVDFDAEQRILFGRPYGVRTRDGRTWSPLGAAFRLYEHGPEESLRLFFLAVATAADDVSVRLGREPEFGTHPQGSCGDRRGGEVPRA